MRIRENGSIGNVLQTPLKPANNSIQIDENVKSNYHTMTNSPSATQMPKLKSPYATAEKTKDSKPSRRIRKMQAMHMKRRAPELYINDEVDVDQEIQGNLFN